MLLRAKLRRRRRSRPRTRRILRQWAADCARSPSAVGAPVCSPCTSQARIMLQSWQRQDVDEAALVHGSVPMPILIPFGHPFGLLRLPSSTRRGIASFSVNFYSNPWRRVHVGIGRTANVGNSSASRAIRSEFRNSVSGLFPRKRDWRFSLVIVSFLINI